MAKSSGRTITIDLDKMMPVFFGLVIVLAFVVGILWQRVSNLEGGGTRVAGTGTGTAPVGDTAAQPSHQATNGKLDADGASRLASLTEDDYIKGNRDAEVTIIEYSDLECPFCEQFHNTAQQAVDAFDGKVAWSYRHFPLDTIHPDAIPAAIGAECAGSLGGNDAFWAFVDDIFANQTTALKDLEGVATKVGLNGGAFAACLEDGSLKANVDADYSNGLEAGVTGTPGNFIVNRDGEVWYLPGAVPFEQLEVTINEALGS